MNKTPAANSADYQDRVARQVDRIAEEIAITKSYIKASAEAEWDANVAHHLQCAQIHATLALVQATIFAGM